GRGARPHAPSRGHKKGRRRVEGPGPPRDRVLDLDREVHAENGPLPAAARRAAQHLPPQRRRAALMAAVLRALTLLGLTGASCALFVQEIIGEWLGPFVASNTMTLANRRRLLIGMVAAAVVAVGAGLLLLWRRDRRRLVTIAHLVCPLILIGFVPQLCQTSAWSNAFNAALVLGVFILLAERLYR